MKKSCRELLDSLFLTMLKVCSKVIKVSAIIVVGFVLLIVGFHLGMPVWLQITGYSDEALYSAGRECVVNTVGVDKINEEAKKVFADWEGAAEGPYDYYAHVGSCLDKVPHELSTSFTWERTLFAGSKALVLRFGCHYNYAWLVIVDPADCVFDKDNKIRRIADNIGVCFDKGKIGY